MDDEAPAQDFDASTTPIPALPDAGEILPVCSVITCMPDDPHSCSEPELEKRLVGSRERRLLLGQSLVDAGTVEGSVEIDASIDSPPPAALGDAGISKLPETDSGEPSDTACRFSVSRGQLKTECSVAGQRGEGEPCMSSRECAPGLGCAGEEGEGQCLAFCCNGICNGENRFCADRPLRLADQSEDQTFLVPVCAEAQTCALGADATCEDEEQGCDCPGAFTCTVVSADGNTGCVMPGDGKQGDDCPCAPGYFCSQAKKACLKMCEVNESGVCGELLTCQAGPNFPEGWGLCIALPENADDAEFR